MKLPLYLLTIVFSTSVIAELDEPPPFYQQRGYTLEKVPVSLRAEVLAPLSMNEEFRRLHGLKRSCEIIYHLADPAGRSVGYGSICKTSHENEKGFFCWNAAGQIFAYARKLYGADAHWIGDSILHGCGGGLVPTAETGDRMTELPATAFTDNSLLPELGLGKRRPVLAMLESDIEDNGFDISLGHCEKILIRWLGREKNSGYAAICQIDQSGKKALICFDNFMGHFGLFTRYQDTSNWAEHTIYGFCWGG
ncbi:hypothetical protein [Pseudomonas japonica]|uniref:hypothetical protein n=1 Tax=Pseudomonas japonica TaxID=256466 RepID=UPI0015E42CA7|nr:hypothetical protein [Pseudomonas japonica]MBA1289752.1 hypothetical protein [Pseudomonas japonica]